MHRRRLHVLLAAPALLVSGAAYAQTASVACTDSTCTPLALPLAAGTTFTLQSTSMAPGCATVPNQTVKFVPTDKTQQAVVGAATCTFKAANGNTPALYDCSLNQAIDIPGRLSPLVCQGNKPVELPVAGTGAAGTSGGARTPGTSRRTSGAEDALPGLSFLPPDLWAATLGQLRLPLAKHRYGNYYDQRNDIAVVFFDGQGTPFFPIPDVIDEDDDIYVAIVDYADKLVDTKVSIQGCNRPPVEPRVYGGGLAALNAKLRAPGIPEAREVKVILRAFGKCEGAASGGPQVVVEADGHPRLATVPVNPLYRLSVGIAFGYDATRVSTYRVLAPAGSSLTRVAESKDVLGMTPLLFVSFYPAARDFRKKEFFAWQKLQLFAGMDTDNLLDNIVIGGGYELTMGLNAMVGWRAITKKKVLSEGSGLSNGSVFDGTTETLPLREKWGTGSVFVGLGLSSDLFARLK